MLVRSPLPFPLLRQVALAGITAALLSACAVNSGPSMRSPDYSGLSATQTQQAVIELGNRYKANPRDTGTAIHFAAALRAAGQSGQAVAVLEQIMSFAGDDPNVRIAYAKALTANGKFDQALNVIEGTIHPDHPDWNALSVKGAILDQMGRNAEARDLYKQAQLIAPNEASLEANLGLSYAMTNDLQSAEQHLRAAVSMPTASSIIRQDLALVIGLQGRFDEARALYSRELPPQQVESNMAYIRALLTQQNRWDVIKGDK